MIMGRQIEIYRITCPGCGGNAYAGRITLTHEDMKTGVLCDISCALCGEEFDCGVGGL